MTYADSYNFDDIYSETKKEFLSKVQDYMEGKTSDQILKELSKCRDSEQSKVIEAAYHLTKYVEVFETWKHKNKKEE